MTTTKDESRVGKSGKFNYNENYNEKYIAKANVRRG